MAGRQFKKEEFKLWVVAIVLAMIVTAWIAAPFVHLFGM